MRTRARAVPSAPLRAFDLPFPALLESGHGFVLRPPSSPHPVQSPGKPAQTVRIESGGRASSKENISAKAAATAALGGNGLSLFNVRA